MRALILFLVLLTISSCKNDSKNNNQEQRTENSVTDTVMQKDPATQLSELRSEEWSVAFEYPDSLTVFEGHLPAETPVINIYDPDTAEEPPFGIHEDAGITYITIIPEGFGVDGPSGEQLSLNDWQGNLPVTFNINREDSRVYLLENGQPWAVSLRFYEAPPGWNDYGSIFIHYGVENYRSECEDTTTGETKAMEECDPLGGRDRMKFYGNVKPEAREALHSVLQNLYFIDEDAEREPISDLIQIETPEPGERISSPLKIAGKARGHWLFEAEAPVQLVDANYNPLARGSIKADEWMTGDFVPVEETLTFSTPETAEGYLVLNKSNASGKPEKDRSFRIPVTFSSN